jgi:hypothetical protein
MTCGILTGVGDGVFSSIRTSFRLRSLNGFQRSPRIIKARIPIIIYREKLCTFIFLE